VLVPDLAGWKRERLSDFPETAWFELAPDWVCEVPSPRTFRTDRVRKMAKYAEHGVPWLWLTEPVAQTVEAFRLEQGHWLMLGAWGGDDPARIEPFDAVELELGRWWRL
jgi:Uma2 family endonuclease